MSVQNVGPTQSLSQDKMIFMLDGADCRDVDFTCGGGVLLLVWIRKDHIEIVFDWDVNRIVLTNSGYRLMNSG